VQLPIPNLALEVSKGNVNGSLLKLNLPQNFMLACTNNRKTVDKSVIVFQIQLHHPVRQPGSIYTPRVVVPPAGSRATAASPSCSYRHQPYYGQGAGGREQQQWRRERRCGCWVSG